jgi:hypothetical protein
MASLIAILSILLVAGAFMWIQPSKRDKQLAKLRSSALTQGFLIGSIKLPDTTEHGRVNDRFTIETIYQVSLQTEKQHEMEFTVLRTSGENGIYLPEGWAWNKRNHLSESIYTAIAEFLVTLPASVTAVMVSKASIGIVWDEKDPELSLEQLRVLLNSIASFCNLQTYHHH